MHQHDPEPIPDSETGLHIVRWTLSGFNELRAYGLLNHKGEYELIDGLVLHRDRGSRRHDAVTTEIARRLDTYYESRPCSAQRDVEMTFDDVDTAVTPDLVVFDGRDDVPRLVVEVSEHSSRVDAIEKERIYARAGVEEYWLLDLPWGVLYIHSSPSPTGYGCRSVSPRGCAAMTHAALEGELLLEDVLIAADAA